MSYVPHSWATYEMITRDLLNHMEQGISANDAAIAVLETWKGKCTDIVTGSKALTNSLDFPFNNSKSSVALSHSLDNANYEVIILSAVATDGNIGDIEITERLVNGFKMEFTGCASSVTVTYLFLLHRIVLDCVLDEVISAAVDLIELSLLNDFHALVPERRAHRVKGAIIADYVLGAAAHRQDNHIAGSEIAAFGCLLQ